MTTPNVTDSKDLDVTVISARILELENILRNRGISPPSHYVKHDDAASDVSDVYVSSPHPAVSRRMMGVKIQAKVKDQPSNRKFMGRKPTMDRRERALCRIMRSHGETFQDIADVVNRSLGVVAGAIKNSYLTPDDTGLDYNFVDEETKRKYPPKSPRVLGKRSQDETSGDEPPAKQQRSDQTIKPVTRSTATVMIETPCNRDSTSQDWKKVDGSVLDFLRNIDLGALYPKLREAGVDNEFFVELQSWTEKAAGELMDDLVNAGVMNRVQAFKIRKALCCAQEGL